MTAPLAGLRVIDAASWLAAPAAARLMSDMGADVIKVESPTGDAFRHLVRTRNPDAAVLGGWQNENRGKRGIALDLEKGRAREILLQLCAEADVLITNLTPERCERYGLTYEAVRESNPHIIYTHCSGYGTRGPDANRLGFDLLAFWARSGTQSVIGDETAPPVLALPGQGDHTATLNILAAVLVALRLRDQTGAGQRVEVSLQQTGVWALSSQIQDALLGNEPYVRPSRLAPVNPISNTYRTRDGRWINLVMPRIDAYWPRFCRALERDEWAEEYPDFAAVEANAVHLRERIDSRIAERDLEDWRGPFDAAELLWAPAVTLEEVVHDPQLRAMDAFEEVEHPTAGRFEMVAAPFHIDGADIHGRRVAPEIGEHTYEVLAEAGFSADQIAAYAAEGAFG